MTEKKRKKKKNYRLPNKMLLIKSCDKDFHEKWYKGRNPLNWVHPARIVLSGKPNTGKSCFIKNAILRAKPEYEKIYVIHADPDAQEWGDVEAEVLDEIPGPDFWVENEEKTLCVLDDIDFTALNKDQKANLGRLVGFCSTHCNLSVAIANQNFFDISPIARKCANIWIVWRPSCNEELNTISRRTGMKAKDIQWIFDNLCTSYYDSLTIDLTVPPEYKLKKNGFQIINIKK